MTRMLVACTLLLALMAASAGSVVAQATPSLGEMDFPDPADCTVEPRTEEEFRTLIQEASAMPAADASPAANRTAPAGTPADDETVVAINATWREFIACINAADYTRIFALTSDDKLRSDFVQDLATGGTEDTMVEFFMAPATALPPEARAPYIPLENIQVLPDGRVSATGPGETGQGEVLIFVKVEGRWLIDDQFDLPVGS